MCSLDGAAPSTGLSPPQCVDPADAMWFHVAGLEIPYRVQYMAVAGGNAFYRKTGRRFTNAPTTEVAMAQNAGSAGGSAFAAARPTLLERLFASAPAW
jgi:hypothetical protein